MNPLTLPAAAIRWASRLTTVTLETGARLRNGKWEWWAVVEREDSNEK